VTWAPTPTPPTRAAAGRPDRGVLVAELTARLGAPHEARFVVDEALDQVLGPGRRAPAGPLGAEVVARARALAARRAAGEPLQYVFGHWPFRTLDLLVDPRVLIPRPETEQVVEVALAEVRSLCASAQIGGNLVAVDAGTGSGAIALSLAAELGPSCREVWATDRSVDALAVARVNLDALRRRALAPLPPVGLVAGNWLEPLPSRLRGEVRLVVANPPYVTAAEWEDLDAEVRCEPRQALVAGPARDGTDGSADVEAVLAQALEWLGRPGVAVVELAPHQADAAAPWARRLGYEEVRVAPDLAGRPRAVVARLAG